MHPMALMRNIITGSIFLSFFNNWILPSWCEISDFNLCQDDFTLNPPDGILDEYTFPWLGFTQYLHEVTGLLHPNLAPRVVLIHRHFVVTTARAMLRLPKHYKLGNMIFGEYEQEAQDCSLSAEDVMRSKRCPRAYMEMPFKDILPHPEFYRFGVNNTLALVQLLRPMKSPVPRDFDFEKMGKRTLKLFKEECTGHQNETVQRNLGLSQYLCTSGCGVRVGAPIISHATDGRIELIGLAVGGCRCKDQGMRRRLNENPPIYVDVYPYVQWIVNVVNAYKIPKAYPEQVQLLRGGSRMLVNSPGSTIKSGWRGRTYLIGDTCFGNWKVRREASLFYTEKFEARANTDELPTTLNITLEISAGIECEKACIRILLPHRLAKSGSKAKLGGRLFSLYLNIKSFSKQFYFTLGISGKNVSQSEYLQGLKDIDGKKSTVPPINNVQTNLR